MSPKNGDETAKRSIGATSTTVAASAATPSSDKSKKKNNGLSRLSHSLAWALRHKALDLGLTLTPDGFVPVDEILNCGHAKFRGYSLDDIRQVVETNDKQRFKLEERPAVNYSGSKVTAQQKQQQAPSEETTILCIRANQGHSISIVDPSLLLQRLDSDVLQSIPVIVHGTYWEAWKSIQQSGLKRMSRTHIHFASGLPKENGVISGMRKSCQVYVYVDAPKCARDGIVFFRSDNGVLLTAGVNDEGTLPPDYFLRVTDTSGKVIWSNDSKKNES